MNLTCKGQCNKCGQCCVPFIPITLEEYDTINKYIKDNNIEPNLPKVKGNDLYLHCPFLTDENKCSIYDVRPEVCRNFICSSTDAKIDHDRTYYDNRADINGKHIDRFIPLDLLFYCCPVTACYIIDKEFGIKSQEDLILHLKRLSSDKEFFSQYKLPNCSDIVSGIESGKILLEFSHE